MPYTPQQQEILLQKMEQVLDTLERRMSALEKASKTPEGQAALGARLGAESATGSEQQIEESNRRLKKELMSKPIFARAYHAAQRITRGKVLRRYSMVPQHRLA